MTDMLEVNLPESSIFYPRGNNHFDRFVDGCQIIRVTTVRLDTVKCRDSKAQGVVVRHMEPLFDERNGSRLHLR